MLPFLKLVTHQRKKKVKALCHGLSLFVLTYIILLSIYCVGNFVFLKKILTISSFNVLLKISVLPASCLRLVLQCDILCTWKLYMWFLNFPLWCLVIFCPGLMSNERQFDYCIKVMAFTIDRFIMLFPKVTNGNNIIAWRTVTLLNGNWSYNHILG